MPEYNSSALDGYEKRGAKGQPNGYASLGPDGKIPIAQIVANVTTGGGIEASTTVVPETTPGLGSAPGTSQQFSRGDHSHGTPSSGTGFLTIDGTPQTKAGQLTLSAGIAIGQSLTAPVLTSSGTIATSGFGVSRVAPSAAVTGAILAPGSLANPWLVVVNESANAITFAASNTSNVASGVACSIAGLNGALFVWDSSVAMWFPCGGTGAGGAGGAAGVFGTAVFNTAVFG